MLSTSAMWRSLSLLACALACAVSGAKQEQPPVSPARPTDPEPAHLPVPLRSGPPPGPDLCRGANAVTLRETASQRDLVCSDGHRACRAYLEVVVRNCTKAAVALQKIVVKDIGLDQGEAWVEARGVVLSRGEAWRHELTTVIARTYSVYALVGSVEAPTQSQAHQFTIENPARRRAMAACEACHGHWGSHGILNREGCICGTSDGGKPCSDGRDCEGMCLADDDGAWCATRVTTFGCRRHLPDGWSDEDHHGWRLPIRCTD